MQDMQQYIPIDKYINSAFASLATAFSATCSQSASLVPYIDACYSVRSKYMAYVC